MLSKTPVLIILGAVLVTFLSCRKDAPEAPAPLPTPVAGSPVVMDLDSVPYATLSHYNFFSGALAAQQPVTGVLPYEPITPLFSDHAHKDRFVWMPAGTAASYVSDGTVLDFPDGAVLIKSFYFDNVQPEGGRRYLETRLMIKKEGAWIFANYIWDQAQNEAVLDLAGAYVPITWTDGLGQAHDQIYRIPSDVECFTCHKHYDEAIPIAPKPQNLNTSLAYADGPMNQLEKWEQQGYLQPGWPSTIETVARWDDPEESVDRRVRAYLDMNCAHCHAEGAHCDYRPLRLDWSDTTDPVNMGLCVTPEDPVDPSQTYILTAGNSARSMLFLRMSSTDEAIRMPLLGRTVPDEDALLLFADWIDQMPATCP